jgi:transposase
VKRPRAGGEDGMRRPSPGAVSLPLHALDKVQKETTPMAMNSTIGCDLGDKFTYACRLDGSGKVIEEQRVATTPAAMEKFVRSQPRSLLVLEVGTHAHWVARLAEGAGHEVIVANARQLPLIYKSNTKTDRNDAERLARLGRLDPKLLAPVQLRSEQGLADLAVLKSREVLVRQRTRLVNHLRGIVKPFGVRLPSGEASSFHKKAGASIPAQLKAAAQPVLAILAQLAERIREFDQQIARLCKEKYPDTAVVGQLKGVGPVTSLGFVLTIGDKHRFQKSRDVGSYYGLTPRRQQSGDSDPQLRISKAGDGFIRRLLVNCAHYILGSFGEDSDLRRWGLKLAERGGKNGKKRAAVAVARKLAVLMHRLWITGEEYQPLGHGQRQQPASVA